MPADQIVPAVKARTWGGYFVSLVTRAEKIAPNEPKVIDHHKLTEKPSVACMGDKLACVFDDAFGMWGYRHPNGVFEEVKSGVAKSQPINSLPPCGPLSYNKDTRAVQPSGRMSNAFDLVPDPRFASTQQTPPHVLSLFNTFTISLQLHLMETAIAILGTFLLHCA